MKGGTGNDTYYMQDVNDHIEEVSYNGGTDTVYMSVSGKLVGYTEILRQIGSADLHGVGNSDANTLYGNSGNNLLEGLQGNDTIYGGDGNDRLDGGNGNDVLAGNAGDDSYYITAGFDVATEAAGQGTDTVYAQGSWTLGDNFEILRLTGTNGNSGTGNALGNDLYGNDGANVLSGLGGDDRIEGGAGNDTLLAGDGIDRLTGGAGRDRIELGGDAARDTVAAAAVADSTGPGRDLVIGLDLAGEDRFDLPGVPLGIAAAIVGGSLSQGSFDADLAAAVSAARLPAGFAVLFDPSAGDQNAAGTVYLVVDANGIAGYQAGQDWVFQLQDLTGTLDPSDFL